MSNNFMSLEALGYISCNRGENTYIPQLHYMQHVEFVDFLNTRETEMGLDVTVPTPPDLCTT